MKKLYIKKRVKINVIVMGGGCLLEWAIAACTGGTGATRYYA